MTIPEEVQVRILTDLKKFNSVVNDALNRPKKIYTSDSNKPLSPQEIEDIRSLCKKTEEKLSDIRRQLFPSVPKTMAYPVLERHPAFSTRGGYRAVLEWVIAALNTPGLVLTQHFVTAMVNHEEVQCIIGVDLKVPMPKGEEWPNER